MIPSNALSCDCADMSRVPDLPYIRQRHNWETWGVVCEPMIAMYGTAWDHWQTVRNDDGSVRHVHVRTPESVEAVTEYMIRAARYHALRPVVRHV